MAGGNLSELGAAGVEQIATPMLQLTGGMDADVTNEANGDPIWEALPRATRSAWIYPAAVTKPSRSAAACPASWSRGRASAS